MRRLLLGDLLPGGFQDGLKSLSGELGVVAENGPSGGEEATVESVALLDLGDRSVTLGKPFFEVQRKGWLDQAALLFQSRAEIGAKLLGGFEAGFGLGAGLPRVEPRTRRHRPEATRALDRDHGLEGLVAGGIGRREVEIELTDAVAEPLGQEALRPDSPRLVEPRRHIPFPAVKPFRDEDQSGL